MSASRIQSIIPVFPPTLATCLLPRKIVASLTSRYHLPLQWRYIAVVNVNISTCDLGVSMNAGGKEATEKACEREIDGTTSWENKRDESLANILTLHSLHIVVLILLIFSLTPSHNLYRRHMINLSSSWFNTSWHILKYFLSYIDTMSSLLISRVIPMFTS